MSGVTQKATIAKAQVFSNSLRNSLMLNLISEWKLDGNANDSWSGGNNGTWYGSEEGTNTSANYRPSDECVSGQCLDFDGVDDLINYGASSALNVNNNFTMGGWVKLQNGLRQPLLGRGTAGSPGSVRIYCFGKDTNNKLFLEYSLDGTLANSVYNLSSTGTIDDNWHYILWTFSSGVSKFYIDGVVSGGYTSSTLTSIFSNSPIAITYVGFSAWNGYFAKGLIDEVSVYNAVIPTSQIEEQYYAGLNKLLANGVITREDYQDRIEGLAITQP
jgi:hypothetical protein